MRGRNAHRGDRVYSHTPEFVGTCFMCKAPVRFGKAAYVTDPTRSLRSGWAPRKVVHRECKDRAVRFLDNLAPKLPL